MERIAVSNINFISEGFDRIGKVFRLKNEPDKIFRLINEPYTDFYKALLTTKNLGKIFAQGLIETKISPEYIGPEGELILEHKKIEDINYGYEWSREMVKDAALFFISLTRELIRNDLFLKDSHYFNITFSNQIPLFFDYGSIEKNKQQIKFVWIDHFFHNFILPLKYFEKNDGQKYRQFVRSDLAKTFNIWRFLLFTLVDSPVHAVKTFTQWLLFTRRCTKISSTEGQLTLLDDLKKIIEAIKISYPQTKWKDYYLEQAKKLKNTADWDKKMKAVGTMSGQITATSLLDIGGNTGLYAKICQQNNSGITKTTIIDYDEAALDLAYRHGNFSGTYVINFSQINKDVEVFWKPGKKTIYPNFASRNKADMVLFLALVHHLTHFQNLSFKDIINTLRQCTNQWLIFEFVSAEDFHIQKWFREKKCKPLNWYTLENLKQEIGQYFTIKKIEEISLGKEKRYLLLCEKYESS